MTPTLITKALIAQLKSGLTVINSNNVYEGVRDKNIVFPCLVVELGSDRVVEYSYPYEKIIQTFKIGGFVSQYNKDHQITDDGVTVGIASLINYVKLAITSNPTLGQNDIYDTKIPSTIAGNKNYPIREFVMNVEVFYRQNRQTRV